MQRRMVQRGFALGLIGVLGAMFIAAPASGAAAQEEEPESSGPAAAEEGLGEQALTPEEQEAMRAWVVSMEEASPMGDTIKPNPECEEKYNCPREKKCAFPDGRGLCEVTQCGEGKCGLCPELVSKMLFKGWCAYGCMNSEAKIVGGAFVLKHPFGKDGGNTDTYCVDKNGKIYNKDGKPIW